MKIHKTYVSISSTVLALSVIFFPLLALAQRPMHHATPDEEAAAAAAASAGCLGCGVVGIIAVVAIIALNIALLVWVARDAKSRGMDSSVLWMVLVIFTGVIGLIIYIFARPQGNLVRCAHCQNKRLQASAKCPHCGNA